MSEGRTRAPIDPRVRDRRREVARVAGRRRLRLLVSALVVVALAVGSVALVRSPLLDVDTIRLEGAEHTATASAASAAGLGRGRTPMLTLDRRTMARRVEALPWVASAKVGREWPSTVVIRVIERVPVATVPVPNGFALVDADARILGTTTTAPPGLVAIAVPARRRVPGTSVESSVRSALDVVIALPERLAATTRGVVITGVGANATFDLDLTTGVKVLLGPPQSLEEKLRAAVAVLDAEQPSGGAVLDVRVPRSPTLHRPS